MPWPTLEQFWLTGWDNPLKPASVASSEAFGTPVERLTLSAGSIGSAEAFGAQRVSGALTATSITSGEAFGVARERLSVAAVAVSSAETAGTPLERLSLAAGSVPSGETFGSAALAGAQGTPPPVEQTGASGGEWPLTGARIIPRPSQRASEPPPEPAKPRRQTRIARPAARTLSANSTPSGEAFGTATTTRRDYLRAPGIPSGEAHGVPRISYGLRPSSADTAEHFDQPGQRASFTAPAIASTSTMGTPRDVVRHDSDEEILAMLHLFADPVGSHR